MKALPPYRFDYARLRIANDQDIAMQRTMFLKDLIERYTAQEGEELSGGYEFRVFAGASAGERTYALELWGELAEVIRYLDFVEWGDRCMRLDVRAPLTSGTPATIRALGDVLAEGNGRLNLTRYQSKGRSKRGGRSSGGVGVALGSHKSVFRASIYKRGQEPTAVEFQWSGTAIAKVLDHVHAFRLNDADSTEGWDGLRRKLYLDGLTKLETSTGLTYEQVLDTLSGRRTVHPDAAYEQMEIDIRRDFMRLPRERQAQLWNSIEAEADF